ncbi:MAG: ABC transporter permease [Acidobacteriota bacterium]
MSDLRDALRALRASPVVSAVAILSLALGIGANTAIFSLIDSLILRALPVREPQRLVVLKDGSWTNPIWEQIRERQSQIAGGACAWSNARFDLAAGGETSYVNGIWASGEFFDVLGAPAILGRTLTPADDRRGGGADGPVAVVSYAFWQRHYGGAADVVGRPLMLDRVAFTVVGVTGPEFFGPDVGRAFDVVVPIGVEPLVRPDRSALDERSWWWLDIMARLKPGQTVEGATGALRGLQPQIREATLPTRWRQNELQNYLQEGLTFEPAFNGTSLLRRRYREPLVALMILVALVLLVACANIANLQLARATARRHELSVRLALGASGWRLARQMLTESVVLAAIGAGLGLLFARWGSALLVRQLSTTASTVFLDLSLDWPVLGFTAAVAVFTAVLFGTVPALRASRVEPNDALKDHARGVAAGRRVGLGHGLVVAQVALSLVLVVAAGLFVRTFVGLANLDLGFDRDRVLIVGINAQRSGSPVEQRPSLFARVRDAAAAIPGVGHGAVSVVTPVSGSTWQYRVEVPGGLPLPEKERGTHVNYVTPDWFATYGTAILAGRDFAAGDRSGAPPVGIVNETFARKFLGEKSPLGHTVTQEGRLGRPPLQIGIVGLARDAVYRSLREPVPPTLYLPLAQIDTEGASAGSYASLSVRAAGGRPAELARSVVEAILGVDRNLSLTVRPLSDQVSAALTQERLVAILSGFFGALALLLAGIGLYGMTSYAVSRQRTEIGIRMALGADPAGVIGMVLRRVAFLVLSGVVVGGLASVWATRFARSLLFGLEPRDPITLGGAAAVLLAVGALAGWLPARRASRIDPARVLREG